MKKKSYRPASEEMKRELGIREFRVPGVILLRWTWHPQLPLYFTFKFLGITVMTNNWHGWDGRLIVKFLGVVIRR
jgi:hypothetical protein